MPAVFKIAGEMRNAVAVVWSRDMFERTAESFVAGQRASLEILDELSHCRLIELTDNFFSFEPELLFDYFKAEDLRRQANDIKQLAVEVSKPRNQDLLELLVPRFSDRAEIVTLLSTADDASLLCRVLAGKCGTRVQSVLLEQCQQFLDAASKDIPNIGIICETIFAADGRRRFVNLDIRGNRQWTAYQRSLCDVIALNLNHPKLRDKFLELLDLTEWHLRAAVRKAARTGGFRSGQIWAEAVRIYGGILQDATLRLPCAAILSSMRTALLRRDRYMDGVPMREQLLERTRRSPESHFSLLALLKDRQHTVDAGRIITNLDLAQQAWNSGITSCVSMHRYFCSGCGPRWGRYARKNFRGYGKCWRVLTQTTSSRTQTNW
jgi:hypothetical protein